MSRRRVENASAVIPVILLVLACSAPKAQNSEGEIRLVSLSGAQGVIFPPSLARELVNPCTREKPEGVDGFWTPEPNDIAELEESLPVFLADALPCYARVRVDNLRYYRRQYGGFTRQGVRSIYVNFFHSRTLREVPEVDWLFAAVAMCDGGPDFFGVEYDTRSRSFQHLAFTHDFSGPFSEADCEEKSPGERPRRD